MGRKKWNLIDSIIFRTTKKPLGYKKVKNPPKTAMQKLTRPNDARQVQYNRWCEARRSVPGIQKKRTKISTKNTSLSGGEWKSLFSIRIFKRKKQQIKKTETAQEKTYLKSNSLLDILKGRKEKFNKEEIIFITQDKTKQIVWLEKGDSEVGLQHIEIRHAKDFQDKHNVSKEKIANHLEDVFSKGEVEYVREVMRGGRRGLEKLYFHKGQYYLLSGLGTNGFIVSGYPIGKEQAKKLMGRYKQ